MLGDVAGEKLGLLDLLKLSRRVFVHLQYDDKVKALRKRISVVDVEREKKNG